MAQNRLIQQSFLNILRKERILASVFLVSGIKLQGKIEALDQFVIFLRGSGNAPLQMIYKHAISTIVSTKDISHLIHTYPMVISSHSEKLINIYNKRRNRKYKL